MCLSFSKLMELAEDGEPEHRKGSTAYKGFTLRTPQEFMHFIPDEFHLVNKWSCGDFRVVWISKKDLAVLTYCEGDLILEIYDNTEEFRKGLKKMEDYYRGQ